MIGAKTFLPILQLRIIINNMYTRWDRRFKPIILFRSKLSPIPAIVALPDAARGISWNARCQRAFANACRLIGQLL
jgi:hypothetical protein